MSRACAPRVLPPILLKISSENLLHAIAVSVYVEFHCVPVARRTISEFRKRHPASHNRGAVVQLPISERHVGTGTQADLSIHMCTGLSIE